MLFAAAGIIPPALLWLYHRKQDSLVVAPKMPTTSPNRSRKLQAFLLMIQYAEGTYGANAYRTLYGGGIFNDMSRHPNRVIRKGGISSSAAGAYQFLYSTWIALQRKLNLPDFSPMSQDQAAIELIRQKGALADIEAGRIATAIYKCRKVWASLPNAGYGQREHSTEKLTLAYQHFISINSPLTA